jgi:methionyl aminopeptidase
MIKGIKIKTPDEIAAMRESCRVAATVLDEVAARCAPGVTTAELDAYARDLMETMGATSAFLGYRGYPAHICTSVNDEVVHGIPSNRRLQLGDIVSIDVGTRFHGWIGDNARTIMIGVQDPRIIRLVQATEQALQAAIAMAVAGGRLTDISHAVEQVAEREGLSIVKEFVGHGVGRTMHEEPQIPNFGPPGRGPRLREGMTLAIEPMINAGSDQVEIMADGWTVLTKDRLPSAHFEHTVLVRRGCPEILTCKKMS